MKTPKLLEETQKEIDRLHFLISDAEEKAEKIRKGATAEIERLQKVEALLKESSALEEDSEGITVLPAKKTRKPKSAEAKKAIGDAQRARWAKIRAEEAEKKKLAESA